MCLCCTVYCGQQLLNVISFLIDPRDWSKIHVSQWLQHAAVQYKLGHTFPERFPFNGKALSILTKEMFEYRVPDGGALLYEDVQLKLKKAAGDLSLQLPGKHLPNRTTT